MTDYRRVFWSKSALAILALWASWLCLLFVFAYVATLQPLPSVNPWGVDPNFRVTPPFARYDAGWYAGIATNGYVYHGSAGQESVRFYPLFPLLLRVVQTVTTLPVFWAGTLTSSVCLLVALLFIGDMSRKDRTSPLHTTAMILVFPSSFYFVTTYTESLMLLCSAVALWALDGERWVLACLVCVAASMTRLTGCLLLVPALVVIAQKGASRSFSWRMLLPVVGAVVGAAAFPLYLARRFGDPWLYFHTRPAGWPQNPEPFYRFVPRLVMTTIDFASSAQGQRDGIYWFELGALVLFLLLGIVRAFQRDLAGGFWVLSHVGVLLNLGTLSATPRFVLPLVPAFLALGKITERRPVLRTAWFVGSTLFLGLCIIRFVHWLWVAA